MIETREILHAHMCCSIGAGAMGFNMGNARVGNMRAKFRCIGGIDVVPSVLRDFKRLTGADGTLLDLFTREQYIAFHGKQPPPGWREATPADIRRAFNNERPHVVFMSAPCKGFSGLLSESRSQSAKYQALNQLALRSVWLVLEAYKDDPPEMLLFENVPRIATRGRPLLDQIESLVSAYDFASAETVHDCGELGNLAQSRKRFLLVCRHVKKVPPFLYEPPKHSLRAVGDVLGKMRLPGDPAAGPMHRIPNLHWKTWVRLAFVEPGKDWRSLERLRVADGVLQDFALVPERDYYPGAFGVNRWEQPSGTIASQTGPSNGNFSVADPRFEAAADNASQQYGVTDWNEPSNTVTSQRAPGQGKFSVSDPRIDGHHKSVQMGVRGWDQPAAAVTASSWAGTGPNSIADPRIDSIKHNNCFRIVRWDEASPAVTAGTGPSSGGLNIADPRVAYNANSHRNKLRIVEWSKHAPTVTGGTQVQGGALSVADPRLPAPSDRLVAVIRSIDNTWHRPFTTLELAALQSLFDPEDDVPFALDGNSDSAWREHIGNAVPPATSAAIASEIGRTLLLAWSGETFALGSTPIWVRPVAAAISVMQRKPL